MASLPKEQAKKAEYQINQWKDQRCSRTIMGKVCEGTFKCEVIQITTKGAFRIERTCKSCGSTNNIFHHKSVKMEPAKKKGTKFQEDYKQKQGIA